MLDMEEQPTFMERSDAVDCVLSPSGTVRLFKFRLPLPEGQAETGRGISSSEGVSSAAGIGSPRAAAMICGSVQLESMSFNPRQNGASLLSIWNSCQPRTNIKEYHAYLQLPNNRLVEVLGPDVCTQGNQIATVHMLFTETPLALLDARNPFTLRFAGLPLLSCLPAFVGCFGVRA